MTVMVAEEAAAGTEATVTGSRARAAGGSARGTGPGRRTGGRTQQGTSRGRRTSAAPRKPAPTAAPKPPPTPQERRKAQRAKATAAVKKHAPTDKAHRTGYQPVILAEFVAAIVLTAATPFADNSRKGISPYAGKDVMQLSAITLTYLILALVSLGGRGPGRVAAWMGGLVLLTVGLSEAANIAKVLDVFGTGKASKQDLAAGGAAGAVGGAEGFSESA